jgi:hypothetical protein
VGAERVRQAKSKTSKAGMKIMVMDFGGTGKRKRNQFNVYDAETKD